MGLHGQESRLLLGNIIVRGENRVYLFSFCYIPPLWDEK
nr:MAG TPA: hypothetical protein [Caudoviricetes sp.]